MRSSVRQDDRALFSLPIMIGCLIRLRLRSGLNFGNQLRFPSIETPIICCFLRTVHGIVVCHGYAIRVITEWRSSFASYQESEVIICRSITRWTT